jgi:hypothetical protein
MTLRGHCVANNMGKPELTRQFIVRQQLFEFPPDVRIERKASSRSYRLPRTQPHPAFHTGSVVPATSLGWQRIIPTHVPIARHLHTHFAANRRTVATVRKVDRMSGMNWKRSRPYDGVGGEWRGEHGVPGISSISSIVAEAEHGIQKVRNCSGRSAPGPVWWERRFQSRSHREGGRGRGLHPEAMHTPIRR